jgi:hypothetical protein
MYPKFLDLEYDYILLLIFYIKNWETFSVKDQIVSILDFADHIVSIITIQL